MWLVGGGFKLGLAYMGVLMSAGIMPEREKYTCMIYMSRFYSNSVGVTKKTYRYDGRNFQLTNVHGSIVHGILT